MQFKKEQKARLMLRHIQNITESNRKTYFMKFRLAQSEKDATCAKKRKAFTLYLIAKGV